MKRNLFLSGLGLALLLATGASAARIGDPAAPLAIEEWVKGKAVDVKDGKNVYVVEFWATWCPPCKKSIPHLTELQKKFKDKGVVFVGVSNEKPATVKPFVEGQGGQMDYVVACDKDNKTSAGYMEAYGQDGIPTAFIVGKEGKVLWFGHPMMDLEETLQSVVDGKYDLAAAVKKDEFRASMKDYEGLSTKGDAKAAELGRKLLDQLGPDAGALCDFAFGIVANGGNPNRDFALAEAALDKAEKSPGDAGARIVAIRAIGRFESGKQDQGLELARKAVELAKTDQEKDLYRNYVNVMERRTKAAAKPDPDKK